MLVSSVATLQIMISITVKLFCDTEKQFLSQHDQMIPRREVFVKLGILEAWYIRIAIRKMHYLLSDKLQAKRTSGSLNIIFRAWPVRNLTSRIGDLRFFPTKLPNRYRYSASLIITIKTAIYPAK